MKCSVNKLSYPALPARNTSRLALQKDPSDLRRHTSSAERKDQCFDIVNQESRKDSRDSTCVVLVLENFKVSSLLKQK